MGRIVFNHPEIIATSAPDQENSPSSNQAGRIYPIYSELQGIKPGRFAQKIREHLHEIDHYFEEYLPATFREKF